MKYSRLNGTPPGDMPLRFTWRPWSLRTLSLVGLVIWCFLLGITIQLLMIGGTSPGWDSECSGPKPAIYLYDKIYGHFVVVGHFILSSLWSIVHHDLLRLEPYFQMSAPGGASAANSLFLSYQFEPQLKVAFKRK